jgi:hypothetical protein
MHESTFPESSQPEGYRAKIQLSNIAQNPKCGSKRRAKVQPGLNQKLRREKGFWIAQRTDQPWRWPMFFIAQPTTIKPIQQLELCSMQATVLE